MSAGDHVAYAGPIMRRSYDPATQTRAVQTQSIRELIGARFTGQVVNYGRSWDMKWTRRSIAGAVRAVFARVTTITDRWALPLDLPEDASGPHSRDLRYNEMRAVRDLLDEWEATGAEIDFRPYWADGALRWQVQVNRRITRGTTDLPLTAAGSPIRSLSIDEDGGRLNVGVLAVGKGSGEDMKTAGRSAAEQVDYPIRQETTTAKPTDDDDALGEIAQAWLDETGRPIEQWSLAVMCDDVVTPEHVQPGRRLRIDVRGDPVIPDGVHEQRVISLRGDTSPLLTPEVQPWR
ncbi:hypothetical protein [Microbacterium sp. gxy059]|uniref:hypothetical protein n=1 Tax=Microbacterium sp. gxy059 TaxID=2957199 RepID=UPI003D97ECA5